MVKLFYFVYSDGIPESDERLHVRQRLSEARMRTHCTQPTSIVSTKACDGAGSLSDIKLVLLSPFQVLRDDGGGDAGWLTGKGHTEN